MNFGTLNPKFLQIQADANKLVKIFDPEIPNKTQKKRKHNDSQHIFTKITNTRVKEKIVSKPVSKPLEFGATQKFETRTGKNVPKCTNLI